MLLEVIRKLIIALHTSLLTISLSIDDAMIDEARRGNQTCIFIMKPALLMKKARGVTDMPDSGEKTPTKTQRAHITMYIQKCLFLEIFFKCTQM